MKTTKKEAHKELGEVQKASPFLRPNFLLHRWIIEIVGGHVNHPDIPDSSPLGLFKIFLAITVSITVWASDSVRGTALY